MKIRLIEPEPPGHARLGQGPAAAPRAAHHRRDPQGSTATTCSSTTRSMAPIDWDDVHSVRPRRPLEHHLHGHDRLRVRRRPARPRHPRRHRRLARHLHGRRGARARRLRGPRRGRRAAHARAHRGAGRRPRARHHRRPLVHGATARPCTTRCASAAPTSTTLPFPDLTPDRRQRAAHDDAHHDQLGLPLRLQLLLGDGDVRQQVPLPQRRERGRRDQGQAPRAHLLLRRQHGRRQEAAQAAAAADDRRGPRRSPGRAQVRTDVVRDPELLELMRRSGCELVYLGLESVNQATLDGFEKSQTVGDIEHAIKVLHDYGIRSHGMFVLGADTRRRADRARHGRPSPSRTTSTR